MIEYQHLTWDTQQLEFGVAKIIATQATPSALHTTLQTLKSEGIQLVYWCSDRGDPESQKAAQDCRGILVDEKITYKMRLPTSMEKPAAVVRYSAETVSPELIQLAYAIGRESRFYLDTTMPRDGYKNIYRTWIKNSVNRSIADEIFVTKDQEKITGFITLIHKGDQGNIALIAVDGNYRGLGLATRLLTAAKDWFIEKQLSYCNVVTQKTNTAACRLYEKNGFSIDKIENFYHFWLDNKKYGNKKKQNER
jgi:ribosomal protein S18 acetylase RimI-like enzyme